MFRNVSNNNEVGGCRLITMQMGNNVNKRYKMLQSRFRSEQICTVAIGKTLDSYAHDDQPTARFIIHSNSLFGSGALYPLLRRNPAMRSSALAKKLFLSIMPSLIQNPCPPIKFAIITSVKSRSPTTAICEGCVTPESGCCLKYVMTSSLQPGFLVECWRTLTPVFFSRMAASARFLSDDVPAVLETMRSLEPG
jgi:hypothetical protein